MDDLRTNITSFVEEVSGESHLRVQDDLGDGFVRLRAAEAQRRQAMQDIRMFEDVVIEMLRNARDAGASAIFVAVWRDGNVRKMTMIDNGSGIPHHLHRTVFEPFVTSKLDTVKDDRWGIHGRGMALYSISENVDEAAIVASALGLGSVFHVEANVNDLPERRDQSSLPHVIASEDGGFVLRGPHNIVRTAMEFALDQREDVAVYLGSPNEVAATLLDLSQRSFRLSKVLADDEDAVAFCQRLAFYSDPDDLALRCTSLALPLSSRSARRIIDGQIAPLPPLLTTLFKPQASTGGGEPTRRSQNGDDSGASDESGDGLLAPRSMQRGQRAVRISSTDARRFASRVAEAFAEVAEAYYLQLDPRDVSVRQDGSRLHVTLPLVPESLSEEGDCGCSEE